MGQVWVREGLVWSGTTRTPMKPYFECNPLKAFSYFCVHPIEPYPDMNPNPLGLISVLDIYRSGPYIRDTPNCIITVLPLLGHKSPRKLGLLVQVGLRGE